MVVYWDENDSLFETYLEYDFYVSAIIHSNLNISSGDKYYFLPKLFSVKFCIDHVDMKTTRDIYVLYLK